MRNRGRIPRIGTCLAVLAPCLAFAQRAPIAIDLGSTLVHGKRALTMLPPKSLGDGVVHAEWSTTGKYVLIVQRAHPTALDLVAAVLGNPLPNAAKLATLQLSIWSKSTGRIARLGPAPTNTGAGFWFAGDETLFWPETLFSDHENGTVSGMRLNLYSSSNGTKRTVTIPFDDRPEQTLTNVERPVVAFVSRGVKPFTTITVVDQNGVVQSKATFEREVVVRWVRWTKGGNSLFVDATEHSNRRTQLQFVVDAATGESRPVPSGVKVDVQSTRSMDPNTVLSVDFLLQPFVPGSAGQVRLAMLRAPKANSSKSASGSEPKSDEPNMALIGANVSSAWVSPNQNAVLYVQNGVALVREFAEVPLDAYQKAREAALREEILSRAKQIGTTMQIFASENDYQFPISFDPEALFQITKNREMFAGFVYTFGGGPMSAVQNIAATEMGYILGPGGRAVVYLDTHVKWITDPPPASL